MSAFYPEIRPTLATGDLVLYEGASLASDVIQFVTRYRWSHIGVVVRDEVHDQVLVWESTTLSNLPDFETGVFRKGVQIVPLSERVRSYRGKRMAIRQLDFDYGREAWEFGQTIADVRREFANRPYEKSLLELARSAINIFKRGQSEDLTSLFCSELVAEVYQRIGILPEPPMGKASNEYVPGDFGTEARTPLLLLRAELGPEIPILSGSRS